LNEKHLLEIINQKYPARDGEGLIEHFEPALSSWIASDDMEFTGSTCAVQREPPRRESDL